MTKIGLMAAAALSMSGLLIAEGARRDPKTDLVHDKDGFVSEADREASLWLAGHDVTLSPAASRIVEERLRRARPFSQPRPERSKSEVVNIVLDAQKPRKFKHNRRG